MRFPSGALGCPYNRIYGIHSLAVSQAHIPPSRLPSRSTIQGGVLRTFYKGWTRLTNSKPSNTASHWEILRPNLS